MDRWPASRSVGGGGPGTARLRLCTRTARQPRVWPGAPACIARRKNSSTCAERGWEAFEDRGARAELAELGSAKEGAERDQRQNGPRKTGKQLCHYTLLDVLECVPRRDLLVTTNRSSVFLNRPLANSDCFLVLRGALHLHQVLTV